MADYVAFASQLPTDGSDIEQPEAATLALAAAVERLRQTMEAKEG